MGKTRLVEGAREDCDRQGLHRPPRAWCSISASVRVRTRFVRWCAAYSRLRPVMMKRALRAVSKAAMARGLLSANRRVFLNDLLDVQQSLEDRATYDAMDNETRIEGKRALAAELLRGVSADSPVAIILEDVHSADRLMLTHLARLAATVADCPALLVVTSRIEGDPLDEAWRAQAAPGGPVTTIDLGPMPRDDARHVAEALGAANTAFAERCVERAAAILSSLSSSFVTPRRAKT